MSGEEASRKTSIEKLRKFGAVHSVVIDGLFATGIEHDKIPLDLKGRLRHIVEKVAAGNWRQGTKLNLHEPTLLRDAVLIPTNDWETKKRAILAYIKQVLVEGIEVSEDTISELESLVLEILNREKATRDSNR